MKNEENSEKISSSNTHHKNNENRFRNKKFSLAWIIDFILNFVNFPQEVSYWLEVILRKNSQEKFIERKNFRHAIPYVDEHTRTKFVHQCFHLFHWDRVWIVYYLIENLICKKSSHVQNLIDMKNLQIEEKFYMKG